jgi:hypothetical protein
MSLVTGALNHYFWAAGSLWEFFFGSVRHYGGCSIAELVNRDWATELVASTINQCILHQLAAAHTAIQQFDACTGFTLQSGYPCVLSPPFTYNSEFANQLYTGLGVHGPHQLSLNLNTKSPEAEDACWRQELTSSVEEAHTGLQFSNPGENLCAPLSFAHSHMGPPASKSATMHESRISLSRVHFRGNQREPLSQFTTFCGHSGRFCTSKPYVCIHSF